MSNQDYNNCRSISVILKLRKQNMVFVLKCPPTYLSLITNEIEEACDEGSAASGVAAMKAVSLKGTLMQI